MRMYYLARYCVLYVVHHIYCGVYYIVDELFYATAPVPPNTSRGQELVHSVVVRVWLHFRYPVVSKLHNAAVDAGLEDLPF